MAAMSGPKICICLCGRKEKASEKKRERKTGNAGVKSPNLSSGTLRFLGDTFIGPLALESLGLQGDQTSQS